MKSRNTTWWAPIVVLALACGGSAPPPASPSGGGGSDGTAIRAGEAPDAPAPVEAPWEKLREVDGIVIHRREVPGSPLIAFKGEGMIEQPIMRVATVLMDVTRSHEWADRVVEARELRVLSNTEVVHYSHVATTFITKDREFVTRITLDVDPGKRIRLRLRSVDDELAPKTSYVRGELIDSSFTLTAEGDARTRIVAELHADPKGSLPKWLVNAFQKSWAHKTINALRTQSARADLKEVPAVRERLTKVGFFATAPLPQPAASVSAAPAASAAPPVPPASSAVAPPAP